MFRRRNSLKVLAGSIAFPYLTQSSWAKSPPSETVHHASFGGMGMAGSDLGQIKNHPNVKIGAIAEIDPNRRRQARQRFKEANVYADWREMLEKEGKHLDSVNVSTPDHMHASMGMSSMQLGLHVYGQKPLTHGVAESRALTEFAKKEKLVTQMGIQIHSSKEYRTAVKIVHDGIIGKIVQAHSFSGKRWGDANPRPDRKDPVPQGFDWNAWIGPAPFEDYIKGYYHPSQWRKRLNYGTGTFGDMGCHIYDPTFKALGLTYPISLKSEGPVPNQDNWGYNAKIHYIFPKTAYSEGKNLPVSWYDGSARPSEEVTDLLDGKKLPSQGSVIIGTKGTMLLPHVGMPSLYPRKKFADHKIELVEGTNHWYEFIEAVRGTGPKPSANFEYAGPLSETILLGGIATRFKDETLIWDAPSLSFKGNSKATSLISREYRKGWEIKGLG
jgi:predicted dehydrogenase